MATIQSGQSGVNAGSARDALRQKIKESEPSTRAATLRAATLDLPSSPSRLISETTDAINSILALAGCPSGSRAFISSVIGAAHSRLSSQSLDEWFEASDLEIARGVMVDRRDEQSVTALKKWTQRHRKAFFDWQKRAGFTLIECAPGGQDDEKNNHATRYRAPVIRAAADALAEARSDPTWQRDPSSAINHAAKIAVAGLPSTAARRERFRRPRRDTTALLKRNTATIKSLFKKNLDLLARKAGFDAAGLVERAQQHFDEIVREAQAALDEVIEQANRDRGRALGNSGESESPQLESGEGGVDKSVHTLTVIKSGQTQGGISAGEESARPESPESSTLPDSIDCMDSPDSQARTDVAAFEQAGAVAFDVSIIGEVKLDGEREFVAFTRNLPVEKLRRSLSALVWKCEREALNFIIRPRAPADRRLIQLDDLDSVSVGRVRDIAFRIVETSDGNFQAWLAVLGADDEMERRLKKSIIADVGANGATRIAGSMNVKEMRRRADGSYPRVRLIAARSIVVDVERLLCVIGRYAPCVSSSSFSTHTQPTMPLPDYDEFVRRARISATGEIDRSMVDFAWAATAIRRGFAKEVVASELERVSLKAAQLAKGTRARYVKRTVNAAARESG